MTIGELKQYRSICDEISEIEMLIEDNTVHSVVCSSDNEFPYLSRSIPLSGIIPSTENSKVFNNLHILKSKKKEIEKFIEDINDSLTKRIFEMRFIKGYSWAKVSLRTNNSVASVKMICYRYIKKSDKK